MSQPIEAGMLCVYIGPGTAQERLKRHRVLESVPEHVITWSQYLVNDLETSGWSWMGDRDSFCKHFRPCLPSEL